MKKIFLFLFLLLSVAGFSQIPRYTKIAHRYQWLAGVFDSTLHIPKGATPSLYTGGHTGSGALFYRTSDSSVYYYTGSQWLKVGSSALAFTTPLVNSSGTVSINGLSGYGSSGQLIRSNGTALEYFTPTYILAADTAAMLSKYMRNVYRKAGSDSVFKVIGGTHSFSFRDSIGKSISDSTSSSLLNDIVYQHTPLTAGSVWVNFDYSPELRRLVAVSHSGVGQDVMTSDDGGITWALQTTPAQEWRGVAWSPKNKLFAAVGGTGTGNRVMTSPDGYTWTSRTSTGDYKWRDVIWVDKLGLFIAVANTAGATDKVATSPDGITWTARTTPDRAWSDVVWSPKLQMLLASATTASGAGRIMYSYDATTWTLVSDGGVMDAGDWEGVTWSEKLGLFCTVSFSAIPGYAGIYAATSPDGITWTGQALQAAQWLSVAYSPVLNNFLAVGKDAISSSFDGTTWTARTTINRNWRRAYWIKELNSFGVIAYTFDVSGTTDSLFLLTRPVDMEQQYLAVHGRSSGQSVLGDVYFKDSKIGIGTVTPNASSVLDLTSTTAGFLAPRMNTTQQNAISSPATGLLIYNTDSSKFRHYDGSAWTTIGGSSGGGGSGTVNTGAANTLAYYPSAGTTVDDLAAITANRALISDANGLPIASSVTNTELGYVSGVTSAIQTQLDAKIDGSGAANRVAYFSDANTLTTSSNFTFNGTDLKTPLVEIKDNGTATLFYNNTSTTGNTSGLWFTTDNGSGAASGSIKFLTGSQGFELSSAGGGAKTRGDVIYGGNHLYIDNGSHASIFPSAATQELRFGAGGTENYVTIQADGDVGINATTPAARLHVVKTTEQVRVGYDGSNYFSTTVSSTGSTTFDLTGTTPEFTFSDAVNVPDEAYGAGWNGSLEVPTKNALYDKIESLNVGAVSTYSPTLTNTTNIAASSNNTTYYIRVGDMVHVWGEASVDATAATTLTDMGMSLPIASDFASTNQLSGTASFEDNTVVQIKADVTNNRAQWVFTPQTSSNNKYNFHFSYYVITP